MTKKAILYEVRKHELRDAADRHFQKNFPHLRSEVTQRLLRETLIFIQGYAKAIDNFAQDPILVDEMRGLLISEGIEYIVAQVVK